MVGAALSALSFLSCGDIAESRTRKHTAMSLRGTWRQGQRRDWCSNVYVMLLVHVFSLFTVIRRWQCHGEAIPGISQHADVAICRIYMTVGNYSW